MMSDRSRSKRVALTWLALAIASLVGLGVLTYAVWNELVMALDLSLLSRAAPLSNWEPVWTFFSELGNYPMIPIGLGFAVWLWWKKRRREAILVLLLFALATGLSEGIKALVARPRPQGGGAGIPGVVYSYPSGHSLEDLMIFGMLAFTIWRGAHARWLKWAVIVLVLFEVVMVSLARVVLAVHYPSDMLAGILIALAMLGLYAWWTRPGGWADGPRRRFSG
jgi:membrane-associated phospholipid phosphatase